MKINVKMTNPLLLLILFVMYANAVSYYSVVTEEWKLFKLQYGKQYRAAKAERARKQIFMNNKNKIARHNKLYEKGEFFYKLGINEYSDMYPYEFVNTMTRANRSIAKSRPNFSSFYVKPYNANVPDFMDWRTLDAVTPIKNQGQCASSWAFSATGAVEGQHFRKTGKLVSLSEQNLVDCTEKYGNYGCEGGDQSVSFQYIKDNKGIDTEAAYPYEAQEGKCRYTSKNSGATDAGYVSVPDSDENALKLAVGTVGPVSASVDASSVEFQSYAGGIFYSDSCDPENLNHAVLVIGYGVQNGNEYWLVKNSWGPSWGEEGYIRMARNRDNNCGIASYATFPLI